MKANRLARDEKGDFGIGTMIIFIAMIVVAVVAATVIIQTMYALQDRALATGNDATSTVATGLSVKMVIGDRTVQNFGLRSFIPGNIPEFLPIGGPAVSSNVQRIGLVLELRAGSYPVNLNEAVINLVLKNEIVRYTGMTDWAPGSRAYSEIVSLRDADGSLTEDNTLNTPGDIAMVFLDISDLGVSGGDRVTAQILPNLAAVPTTTTITMPVAFPSGATQVQIWP